jgi:hypothetical protein
MIWAMLAQAPPMPFSLWILLSLLLACGLAVWVFFELSRQWVTRRQWVSLRQWAWKHGFALQPLTNQDLPAPLIHLPPPRPKLRLHLSRQGTVLAELQPDDPGDSARWNVLIRELPANLAPASLRPVSAGADRLISRFVLTPRHVNERFEVLSDSEQAAAALRRSPAQTLLPPDIGLLLYGRWMLLEFSSRPFDPIEFSRMLSLADQLGAALSAVPVDA